MNLNNLTLSCDDAKNNFFQNMRRICIPNIEAEKMKTLFPAILLALLATTQLLADSLVPPLVNYQGLLTDENGQPIPDGMRKLEFNLYDAPLAGTRVWGPQVFDGVPVVNGRFNVILGTTDGTGRSIAGAFATSARYLGFKAGAAGANLSGVAEISPRQQILSAPYALSAERAGRVDFPHQNTDWGAIYFESTGDQTHLSNMVFETFDDSNEGFIFRTTGTERAKIDDLGLRVDRIHSHESLQVIGPKGVYISRDSGGSGSLTVEGLMTAEVLSVRQFIDAGGFNRSDCRLIDSAIDQGSLLCPIGYYMVGAQNRKGRNDTLDKIWCCSPGGRQ